MQHKRYFLMRYSNNQDEGHPLSITPHRAKNITISAAYNGNRYKLFQLFRGKHDASIYLNFPYFKTTKGIVSVATIPPGNTFPINIALAPGGKVTSHLVKYSHHPDGRVHFSQDGKVITEIKKTAQSLDRLEGHFFTAHFNGITSFDSEPLDTRHKSGKLNLHFDLTRPSDTTLKICGRLYSKETLTRNAVNLDDGTIGPILPVKTQSGPLKYAYLIGSQNQEKDERYILIDGEGVLENKNTLPGLSFIGGFDPKETVNNKNRPTSFLAMAYPIENYDSLKQRIGTIDFV